MEICQKSCNSTNTSWCFQRRYLSSNQKMNFDHVMCLAHLGLLSLKGDETWGAISSRTSNFQTLNRKVEIQSGKKKLSKNNSLKSVSWT